MNERDNLLSHHENYHDRMSLGDLLLQPRVVMLLIAALLDVALLTLFVLAGRSNLTHYIHVEIAMYSIYTSTADVALIALVRLVW